MIKTQSSSCIFLSFWGILSQLYAAENKIKMRRPRTSNVSHMSLLLLGTPLLGTSSIPSQSPLQGVYCWQLRAQSSSKTPPRIPAVNACSKTVNSTSANIGTVTWDDIDVKNGGERSESMSNHQFLKRDSSHPRPSANRKNFVKNTARSPLKIVKNKEDSFSSPASKVDLREGAGGQKAKSQSETRLPVPTDSSLESNVTADLTSLGAAAISNGVQPNRSIQQTLYMALEQFRRVFGKESTSVEAVPYKRPYVIGTCVWNFNPSVDIIFESRTSMLQGAHNHKRNDDKGGFVDEEEYESISANATKLFPSDNNQDRLLPTVDSNNLAVKRAMVDAIKMICSGNVSPTSSLQMFKAKLADNLSFKAAVSLLETLDLSISFNCHYTRIPTESFIAIKIEVHDPYASAGPLKTQKAATSAGSSISAMGISSRANNGFAVPITTLAPTNTPASKGILEALDNSITNTLLPYLIRATAIRRDEIARETERLFRHCDQEMASQRERLRSLGEEDEINAVKLSLGDIIDFKPIRRSKIVRTIDSTPKRHSTGLRCKVQDEMGNMTTFNYRPIEALMEPAARYSKYPSSSGEYFLQPPLSHEEDFLAPSGIRVEVLQSFIQLLHTDRCLFALKRECNVSPAPSTFVSFDTPQLPCPTKQLRGVELHIFAHHLLPVWGSIQVALYNAQVAQFSAVPNGNDAKIVSSPATDTEKENLLLEDDELSENAMVTNEVFQRVSDALMLVPSVTSLYPRTPLVEVQQLLRFAQGTWWLPEKNLEQQNTSLFSASSEQQQKQQQANTILWLLNPCVFSFTASKHLETWLPQSVLMFDVENKGAHATDNYAASRANVSLTTTTAPIVIATPLLKKSLEHSTVSLRNDEIGGLLTTASTIVLSRFEGTHLALKAALPAAYLNWSHLLSNSSKSDSNKLGSNSIENITDNNNNAATASNPTDDNSQNFPKTTEASSSRLINNALRVIKLQDSLDAAQLRLRMKFTRRVPQTNTAEGQQENLPENLSPNSSLSYFVTANGIIDTEYLLISAIGGRLAHACSTLAEVTAFVAKQLGLTSVTELPTTIITLNENNLDNEDEEGSDHHASAGSTRLSRLCHRVLEVTFGGNRFLRSNVVLMQSNFVVATLPFAHIVGGSPAFLPRGDTIISHGKASSIIICGYNDDRYCYFDLLYRSIIPLCVPTTMNSSQESFVSSTPLEAGETIPPRLASSGYTKITIPEALLPYWKYDFFTPQFFKRQKMPEFIFGCKGESSALLHFLEHPTIGLFPRFTVKKPKNAINELAPEVGEEGSFDVLCSHEVSSVVIKNHVVAYNKAPKSLNDLYRLRIPKEIDERFFDMASFRLLVRGIFRNISQEVIALVQTDDVAQFKKLANEKSRFDKEHSECGGEGMDSEYIALNEGPLAINHLTLAVKVYHSTSGQILVGSSAPTSGYGIHGVGAMNGLPSELAFSTASATDLAARSVLYTYFPLAHEFMESVNFAKKYISSRETKDLMGWKNILFVLSEGDRNAEGIRQPQCTFISHSVAKDRPQNGQEVFMTRAQRENNKSATEKGATSVASSVSYTVRCTGDNYFQVFIKCVDEVTNYIATKHPEALALGEDVDGDGQQSVTVEGDNVGEMENREGSGTANQLDGDVMALALQLRSATTSPPQTKNNQTDEEDESSQFLIQTSQSERDGGEAEYPEPNNDTGHFQFMGRTLRTKNSNVNPKNGKFGPRQVINRSEDDKDIDNHTLSVEALKASKFNGTLLDHIFVVLTAKNKRCVSFHTTISEVKGPTGGLLIKLFGTTVVNTTEELCSIVTDAENLIKSLFTMYKNAVGEEFWNVILQRINTRLIKYASTSTAMDKLTSFISRSLKISEEENIQYIQESRLWAATLKVPLKGLGFDVSVGDSSIGLRGSARRTKKEALNTILEKIGDATGIRILATQNMKLDSLESIESKSVPVHTSDSLLKAQYRQPSLLDTLVAVAIGRVLRTHPDCQICFVLSETGVEFYMISRASLAKTAQDPAEKVTSGSEKPILLWRSNTPSLMNILRGYATIADSFAASSDPPLLEILLSSSTRWTPLLRTNLKENGPTSASYLQCVLRRFMGWNMIAEGDNSFVSYRAFEKSNNTIPNKMQAYQSIISASAARDAVTVGGAGIAADVSGYWSMAEFSGENFMSTPSSTLDSTFGEETFGVPSKPSFSNESSTNNANRGRNVLSLPPRRAWWSVEYDLPHWTARLRVGGHIVGTASSSKKREAFFSAVHKLVEESFPYSKTSNMIDTDWILNRESLIKPSESYQFFGDIETVNTTKKSNDSSQSGATTSPHRNWSTNEAKSQSRMKESRFRRPTAARATLL